MNFQKEATSLIGIGFKVFPLISGSKVAFTKKGVYDATDNLEQVARWSKDHESLNIAVGCGPESGVMVLDIDKHHGGIETLKGLIKKIGGLPKAPMQQTPQGGFHMFFKHDARIGNSVGSAKHGLGAGLDVKSRGGYVVLAPSHWDGMKKGKEIVPGGGDYKWIRAPRGTNFPELPEAYKKLLLPKPVPAFAQKKIDLGDATLSQVVQALMLVSNQGYGTWYKMGMALKEEFGDAGFDAWLNWSASGYEGFDQGECAKKWRGFGASGAKKIGIGSIFYEAKAAGADLGKIFAVAKPPRGIAANQVT